MIVYLQIIETPEERSKFEQLYLEYKGLMFHVAFDILHNEQDAEDAVHQAFIKIAENIKKIDEPMCPKTHSYVVTIVENQSIDQYRKQQKRQTVKLIDETHGISVQYDSASDLTKCILKLPARYREMILLRYHQGYTVREISKILGLSLPAAIKLDQRAKNKLKKLCSFLLFRERPCGMQGRPFYQKCTFHIFFFSGGRCCAAQGIEILLPVLGF